MRRVLTAFAILCPVLVLAQPGGGGDTDPEIDVEVLAPPDTPYISVAPRKVSGTCVEISCLATKSCVPWVLVGGMVKIENDYIPAPFTPGADIAGLLRIDSTHWQHGTNLHISMLATYHNPQTGANRVVSSPIRTTQVWNSACIFKHPAVGGTSSFMVQATAASVKYSANLRSEQIPDYEFLNWSKDSQWVNLRTHGALNTYNEDGSYSGGVGGFLTYEHHSQGPSNPIDLVSREELADSYEQSSQEYPPVNLVLQLACPLESPAENLSPHYVAWGAAWLAPTNCGVRDRCYTFYRGTYYWDPPEAQYPTYTEGYADVADAFTVEFYGKLLQGHQAWVARDNAAHESLDEFLGHYHEWIFPPPYNPAGGAENEFYFDWLRELWPCLGDNCMTLTGVYRDGYDPSPNLNWWRWVTP